MDVSGSGSACRARLARRVSFIALILAVVSLAAPPLGAADRAAGIRAVWMSSAAVESPEAFRRAVSTARADGFDTVLVPIGLADAAPGPAFDRLSARIGEAHDAGLRVHAWVQATVVAPPGELPAARDHVIYRHPEWLMVPRELATELLELDLRAPDYIGRLARWTRANAGRTDGLYLSPLHADVAAYAAEALTEIVTRFDVDGVHFDAMRFPGLDFDYGRQAMDVFRRDLRPRLSEDERAYLDYVETIDPFAYAEEFPAEWRRFRVTRLTALVTRLRTAVKSVRPDAIVSATVTAGAERAMNDELQDWRTWLDNGFVDALARRGTASTTLLFSYDALIAPSADSASAPQPSPAAGSH
jgi:uncharacterized lipoprotein YddW (UPF0748 family)